MEKEKKKKSKKPKPEVYNKLKMIGKGASGKAYLVECGSDKSKAVIKQISVGHMSETEAEEATKESKIMEYLSHPNIIKFRETYKTKKGNLCIVMDYADDGDLHDYLESQGTRIKEYKVLDMFAQICLAIKYAHDEKIIHRDIKAQNIFKTKSGLIKLGDFGIAKVLASTTAQARTQIGTPCYLSPEVTQDLSYRYSADVWSLGILLYQMCALEPPFTGKDVQELFENIVAENHPPLPVLYSPELNELVSKMLRKEPELRVSINEIIKDPLMKDSVLGHIHSDSFKEEYLRLTKFMKPRKSESKEEEKEPSSKSKTSEGEKMYLSYVNKIEEMISPPEECVPGSKKGAKKGKTK